MLSHHSHKYWARVAQTPQRWVSLRAGHGWLGAGRGPQVSPCSTTALLCAFADITTSKETTTSCPSSTISVTTWPRRPCGNCPSKSNLGTSQGGKQTEKRKPRRRGRASEENCSADAPRAAMRLELSVCTCYWMTHPPSQLAAVPGGPTSSGARNGREVSARQPPRAEISRCAHPPPPPVPPCRESALNPGKELCGRRVPCEWFAGSLHPGIPGFLFSSTKEGQRELSTHKLVPGVVFSSRGSRGFEAPLQCHLETRSSPGDEDGRGALQRSFRRAACVYRGLRVTPDLRRLLRGRKAPVVDTEEALKTWAETHRLQSACPPPPLRSCYLSNDESLRTLESRTT